MNRYKLNGLSWEAPASWEELPQGIIPSLYPYLIRDTLQNRLDIMLKIADKPTTAQSAINLVIETAPDNTYLLEIVRTLNFIYAPREISGEPPSFSPLAKKVKLRGKWLYFPREDLLDVSLDEWANLTQYFREYLEAEDDETRDEKVRFILAGMLRPRRKKRELNAPDFNGFPRIPFNSEVLQDKAVEMASLPSWAGLIAVDYMNTGSQLLRQKFAPIFEGKRSDSAFFGWFGTVWNLAESGTFGPEKDVNIMSIQKACFYMLKTLLDTRQREREKTTPKPETP